MTDERDDLDRALAAGLGGLAGDEHDTDIALASMRPRLRRARRRHRVAQGAVVVAVLAALVGAGALVTRPAEKRGTVEISPTTTADPRRGTYPPGPGRTTTTVKPATVTTAPPRTGTTTPTNPAVGGASPNHGPGPNPGPGGSNSNSGSNSGPGNGTARPTPTTPAPPETHTYTAPGGTMTIRFANGAITLISHSPNAGYTEEIHDNQADRIEIRFSGPTDSRIRVRVENGKLVEEKQ